MDEQTLPIRFIGEQIEVAYQQEQIRIKNPGCPDVFTWRSKEYTITRVINQWTDFSRRGNMQRNMSEAHHAHAERKGSWGVGKIFFRVEVDTHQVFDIYFDRAPQSVSDREGNWFLLQECLSNSEETKK